jgi:site-specific recombinase XerD
VSRFFAYLREEDEIAESPMKKMKPPRPAEKLVPVIDENTLVKLFRTVNGKDFESRRDRALFSLWIDTGLRISEMAALKVEDVDMERRELRVLEAKGRRPRIVSFAKAAAKDVRRYLQERGEHLYAHDPALWIGRRGEMTGSGLYRTTQRRCEEAKIPPVHPHQFRHSFAHYWLTAGGNEGDLMRLTGWKSRSMVDRYGGSAAGTRARAAHARFSPRDALHT